VDNIINFGCAYNVFGGISEHNIKPNVKDPARRTRYQDDLEYNILFKQYEKHLLHAGEIELNIRSALEGNEVNDVKYEEQYTRLGIHIKFKVVEGEKPLLSQMKYGKDVLPRIRLLPFFLVLVMCKVFCTLSITLIM